MQNLEIFLLPTKIQIRYVNFNNSQKIYFKFGRNNRNEIVQRTFEPIIKKAHSFSRTYGFCYCF